MNYLDLRIDKIKNAVLSRADAMLITADVTRQYAFGFASSAGYGYISAGRCELYLDFRYFEKACVLQNCGKISKYVKIKQITAPRAKVLSEIIKADKTQKLLYEDRRMSCSEFEALKKELSAEAAEAELSAAGNAVDELRACKDEYELGCIAEAQRITDLAFSHIVSYIRDGRRTGLGLRECDIALELEYFMRKNGAGGIAFDTICVSGAKSSMPHGVPDETVVSEGFLTMDFGARFDGYCADMTRTLCIGNPDAEMKKIYDTVLEAQNSAFSKIRGGVKGKTVDSAAREIIYSAGFKGCFGHSTGHSLGLEIHESPNFSPNEETAVPAGAVVSVEPGIYISGRFGVRIEDIVFLTENGYKNLTNSTKEFIILK